MGAPHQSHPQEGPAEDVLFRAAEETWPAAEMSTDPPHPGHNLFVLPSDVIDLCLPEHPDIRTGFSPTAITL